MKKIHAISLCLFFAHTVNAQNPLERAQELKNKGLLMPALQQYGEVFAQSPSPELSYEIASITALLWTSQMRDTSFFFLNYALQSDSTLEALYDPQFLSLIDDPRWEHIERTQIKKYEAKNQTIKNKPFAIELFKMIIKDQGFMYAGNIERRKYIENGGYFDTPSVFPLLAMEEKNKLENEKRLLELLDIYGWPSSSEVTEFAAAGAALIINHTTYELRSKYFPMLEDAFKRGEAQPLRYAKMKDRLLVEEGKEQLYGTQIEFKELTKKPFPIQNPEYVDQRRAEIGLGPLKPYLKSRFDIDWTVVQKQ